jgi:hypothetical protein
LSDGLVIDDSTSQPTAYAGKVSGFGGVGHANHTQFIDLVSVAFAPFEIGSTYSAARPPAAAC